MAGVKRGLGRGLSALIPDEDMELFRRVARDEMPIAERVVGESANASLTVSTRAPDENTSFSEDSVQNMLKKETTNKKRRPSDSTPHPENKTTTGAIEDYEEEQGVTTANVTLDDIEPNPYQPRRVFDEAELNDLAASLREHGIIQPIIVRPSPKGDKKYQLVAGERRWRAAQRAGLLSLPAIVRAVDDLQALELALIENVQRHDISAIDAALAYRRLADEFRLSQEDISRRVGKSRSAVANTMRLLDLLPEIRKAIEDGGISEGHGRAILLAQGDAARRALFRHITRDHLSVRDAERLAREILRSDAVEGVTSESSKIDKKNSEDKNVQIQKDYIADLSFRLQKKIGSRLKIHHGTRGGRLVIEYSTEEELNRIVEFMEKS